jgi:hypothetical protein
MKMPAATTVVTSARFDQGLTYKDFLAAATVNRGKFEQNYENPVLTEDDLAFFRKSSELPDGHESCSRSRKPGVAMSTGNCLPRLGSPSRPGWICVFFCATRIPISWTNF